MLFGKIDYLNLLPFHVFLKRYPLSNQTKKSIEFKKAPSSKMNNIFKDNLRRRLVRPVSDQLLNFVDFDVFQYEMDNDNQYHDIGIEGFGWFTFLAKGQTIRITLPHKAALKECLSKVQ